MDTDNTFWKVHKCRTRSDNSRISISIFGLVSARDAVTVTVSFPQFPRSGSRTWRLSFALSQPCIVFTAQLYSTGGIRVSVSPDPLDTPLPITIPSTSLIPRPVTLLPVLVFQGEEGVLQTVLQGEGGGIVEIRERVSGIWFWTIDRDF